MTIERLSDPLDEAKAVLEKLKERASSYQKGLLTFKSTLPGPESLSIFARRAVNEKGQVIHDKVLFGIISGLAPYVDWLLMEAKESPDYKTGSWSHDKSRTRYGLKNCQIVQAVRLKTPDGKAFLLNEPAWSRCEELKGIYNWGTRVSSLTVPETSLTATSQSLSPTFFDRLAKEFYEPIASMEHEESWFIAEKLLGRCEAYGNRLCCEGEAPNFGSTLIYGKIEKPPSFEGGEYYDGIGKVMIALFEETRAGLVILRFQLSKTRKDLNWRPFGETGLFYLHDLPEGRWPKHWRWGNWHGSWYMSKGMSLDYDARKVYPPGRALLEFNYITKREGMAPFKEIYLPGIPSRYRLSQH